MSGNLPRALGRLLPGKRSSASTILLIISGFLIFHLVSLVTPRHGMDRATQLLLLELEQVEEEEKIQLPPSKGNHSPQGPYRRPERSSTLIDEFLDENSQVRRVFFPDAKTAVGQMKDVGDMKFYYPGRIWLDTEGNPIQAHGGGTLYDERSETYYWYGEYKDGPTYYTPTKGTARVDIIGVGCYSSKDLWRWKNEGIVLAAEETNEAHDLHRSNVLERPKVIYNSKTRKYVMWMHIDDANYTKASVGIAVSDSPIGPFTYLHSKQPHGYDSRDMTVFKDDDGVAYLVYSSVNNKELHIGPVTDDYQDVTPVVKRILVGQHREAPAIFKYHGTYYMITSGCTGWAPNEALAHAAESVMGPWETLGNPSVGGNRMFRLATFLAQSTFVIPLPGLPGRFVFMADRWNPANLRDSRYVWLPLVVESEADQALELESGLRSSSRVSIYWHHRWRLPSRWSSSK